MSLQAQCPKCNAELPRRGRFCLECGLDLYEEGLHSPPRHWVAVLVIVLLAGGVVALLATRPPSEDVPPEERAVRRLTADLLELAAAGRHAAIVEHFCEPDKPHYEKAGGLLGEIVRGSGAPGLNVFRATCMDDLEEATKFVDRYKAEHPEYIVRLLAAITFEDGALRTKLGGAAFGSQRTDLFLAWFLERVFADAEPGGAEIVKVEWTRGLADEPLLTVTLRYPEPPETLPGVPSPTVISWRRLGEGAWAITLTDETNLQELLDLLRRAKL